MKELAVTLPDGGQVRKTADGRASVYDLLKAAGAKDQRKTFKRLAENFPHILDLVIPAKFARSDGKRANCPSPAVAEKDWGLLEAHLKAAQALAVLPAEARPLYLSRRESAFAAHVDAVIGWRYPVVPQFEVLSYRVDIYVPELNLAIEFDESHHKGQQRADERRQSAIAAELGCRFIRVDINREADGLREISQYAFGPLPHPRNGLLTVDV